MPDHVHIVVPVHPTDSPDGVTRRFKGRTGRVLRAGFLCLIWRRGLWSRSYFAASVGYTSEQTLRRCIEHQWDAA
jgi:putative transposase